jgi:hypothetical protein
MESRHAARALVYLTMMEHALVDARAAVSEGDDDACVAAVLRLDSRAALLRRVVDEVRSVELQEHLHGRGRGV